MNIPIFIPHLGCPNDCVFCNQRHISGEQAEQREEQMLRNKIEAYLDTGIQKSDIEIAFFGGSFTGIDVEIQTFYLDIATEYVKKYHLKGIRMSTRPDYISIDILEFLSQYPISAIELGVQSLDQDVLDLSKRNHRVQDVYNAVDLIRKYKIEVGLQVMLGLPGDTAETFEKTMEKVIQIQPKTLRIYPTLVIQHTELEALYKRGDYVPISLEEAVLQVANVLPKIIQAKIKVIRIGLQANEELNTNAFVAGPYHPAFGELVMDQCIFKEVMTFLETHKEVIRTFDSRIILCGNQASIQRLIGHKKKNKEKLVDFLKEKMDKRLEYRVNPDIQTGEIHLFDLNHTLIYSIKRIGF
jgi:histone acetyltransferase (RNA polymerase elongator complex component)